MAGRTRMVIGAAEVCAADLSDKDQTVTAVAGSSIVYLLVGLKYDRRALFWREMAILSTFLPRWRSFASQTARGGCPHTVGAH